MKHALMALVLLVACGKSGEEQAKDDNAREAAKIAAEAPKEEAKPQAPTPAPPPTETASADKPPEPEPTTPAEIDKARNQAMIDGRDKDVLKYCEMGKLDEAPAAGKPSNAQALLGCTLAACRLKDEATARKYAAPIKGPLRDQAKKVCLANQIGI